MNHKSRIFVLDDEPEILENYHMLLGDTFDLVGFSNPQAFLDELVKPGFIPPDMMITDLKMPGIDGLETIRRAQEKNFSFPVIIMSGFLDKEAALRAVDLGVFRILEKPTPIDVLRAAIDQLLVEHEVYEVRKEIRQLTSQLRELYTGLRMALMQYIPENVLERMVVSAPDGVVKKKMSFEELLEVLEARLEKLLKSEQVLSELRVQKYRD